MHFIDTQECNNNNGGCDQNCYNTFGSYYCTCNNGYNLTSNGHSCIGMENLYNFCLLSISLLQILMSVQMMLIFVNIIATIMSVAILVTV